MTAPALVLPLFGALIYFVWLTDHSQVKWIYQATKLFTFVWPLIAMGLILKQGFSSFSLKGVERLDVGAYGIGSGCLIAAASFLLMLTPIGNMIRDGAAEIEAKSRSLGVMDHYWQFAVAFSLFHSLLEEYYWRWFVFGRIRQVVVRPWITHGVCGVAFAAHHIVVTTQFFPLGWGIALGASVGIGGIIWSVLVSRQKTLLGAWISHILVDLALFTIGAQVLFR